MKHARPPQLLIASRIAPGEVGGLAGYQLQLARHVAERSNVEVSFLHDANPPQISPATRQLWMSLASRPPLHRLLELWIERHFRHAGRKLASRNFSAVHFVGTGWDFLGFAMRALARQQGARFTIWPAVHPGRWGDDHIDMRLYRAADAVFCQSQHEISLLKSQKVEKTVLCGLPPMCLENGQGQRLRTSLEIGQRPVVFFLGRRVEGKGYPALLEAWKTVIARTPEAVLLIAGPDGEEYASRLADLPRDSFRDLGVISEQDKADAYAACDVFCLPSSEESFGIVFVEAWSYKKPVICGTAPASRELVKAGATGLHCSQPPESIADAVTKLLANPRDAARMGAAGWNFQQTNLTWPIVVKTHLQAMHLGDAGK